MARPKQNTAEKPQQAVAPKKKLSLNEFRAWLSGVEEMQPEDWTPNANQWRTIRSKIEEVIDVPAQRQRIVDDEYYEERPRGPIRPAGPSAFNAGQSSMAAAPTALAVETNLVAVPGSNEPGGVRSGGLKIKTPNIDTSNTQYVAAFE